MRTYGGIEETQKRKVIPMKDYQYIDLRGKPELMDTASAWFNSKWGVPK